MHNNLLRDKYKLESLARIAVSLTVSYVLSVADLPSIIPPSTASLVGLISAILATVTPKLLYVIPALYPAMLSGLLICLLVSTALLACPTDGIFLAVFAVYTLFISGMCFGEKFDQTSGAVSVYIALPAMLSLSYRPLVVHGIVSSPLDLWTEKGTTNPLSAFPNFLIAICWAMAATALGVVLPPIRTMRWVQSQVKIPAALRNVIHLLDDDDDGAEAEEEEEEEALLQSKRRRRACIHDSNTTDPNKAQMIVFEPRCLRCGPLEYLVPQLRNLLLETNLLITSSLVIHDNDRRQGLLEPSIEVLKQCVAVLSQGKQEVPAAVSFTPKQNRPKEFESFAKYIEYRTGRLRDATVAWIEALLHPADEVQNVKKIYAPWLLSPLAPLQALGSTAYQFFLRKEWSWFRLFYSLKLTAGYTALFAMVVYWDRYRNFAIHTDNIPIGHVFAGWSLFAYAFSWMPAMEGTIEKGLQRVLGTALGGFFAWLGVIFCSGSYDETAPINPYKLTAWLVVTSLVAAALGQDPGFPSLMGLSKDHGYVCMYFIVTEVLIAFNVFLGHGSRDDVVVNRVVANITGVLMAMIIAVIPPFVRGGDPIHTEKYLLLLKEASHSLAQHVAENAGKSDTMESFKRGMEVANKQGRFCLMYYNNAAQLHMLHLLRVDERLLPVIEQLKVVESMIQRLGEHCSVQEDWNALSSDAARYSNAPDEETNNKKGLNPWATRYSAIKRNLREAEESLGAIQNLNRSSGNRLQDTTYGAITS